MTIKPTKQEHEEDVKEYNIGRKGDPRVIKLAKAVPKKYKKGILAFLRNIYIYIYVFSWSYDDLNTFDINLIQHKIYLKDGVKTSKKKLRKIIIMLLPSIEKEVKKLLWANIIIPLRYLDWVTNLVPDRIFFWGNKVMR